MQDEATNGPQSPSFGGTVPPGGVEGSDDRPEDGSMIAAELRGGNKPSLNEALGWIGSRVDDIYGASVGRLEDVWIDPGTGVPRWLLVKEGRFGGRTTLIPFEDATAGAGHVWVPYEREIVRDAPEIEPGAPLTQQVEAALRSHYAANIPPAISHGGQPTDPSSQPATPAPTTAAIRFAMGNPGGAEGLTAAEFGRSPDPGQQPPQQRRPPEPPRRPVLREQPGPTSYLHGVAPSLPPRPAPPTAAPGGQPYTAYPPYGGPPQQPVPEPGGYAQGWQAPVQTQRQPPYQQGPSQQPQPQGYQLPQQQQQQPQPQPQGYQPPQSQPFQPQPPPLQPQDYWQPPPQPAPAPPTRSPYETLAALAGSPQVHYVEIELSGELSIRGELRNVRVVPRDPRA